MRLSIIATPAQHEASIAPAQAIDGRLIRTRLGREDAGFDVVQADPGQDLAEQIEGICSTRAVGAGDAVMLHAVCPLLLSVEGELFRTDACGGASAALLLAGSHVCLHTWPQERGVTVDVCLAHAQDDFSAKARGLMFAMVQRFQPEWTEQRSLDRGDGE